MSTNSIDDTGSWALDGSDDDLLFGRIGLSIYAGAMVKPGKRSVEKGILALKRGGIDGLTLGIYSFGRGRDSGNFS